jgi:hypothetical protein
VWTVTVLEIITQSDHVDWGGAFKEITVTYGVNHIVDDSGTSLGNVRIG